MKTNFENMIKRQVRSFPKQRKRKPSVFKNFTVTVHSINMVLQLKPLTFLREPSTDQSQFIYNQSFCRKYSVSLFFLQKWLPIRQFPRQKHLQELLQQLNQLSISNLEQFPCLPSCKTLHSRIANRLSPLRHVGKSKDSNRQQQRPL